MQRPQRSKGKPLGPCIFGGGGYKIFLQCVANFTVLGKIQTLHFFFTINA
jgi:hypothetical protein